MKKFSCIIAVMMPAVLFSAPAQKPMDAGAAQWNDAMSAVSKEEFIINDWREANPAVFTDIGPLTGFYRYTQLQGHLVQDGLYLFKVPDFWFTNSDFPYLKKDSEREVFFVDEFSVTRFAGGYSQHWLHNGRQLKVNDMVFVDDTGAVHYRLELVKDRLQQYIDNGYTRFIIGIENVWDLSRDPAKSGPYGPTEPPRDWQEWYNYVKALCEEMKRVYPDEVSTHLKFKIGNEYNQKKSFSGTHEDYLKLYDWSAAAIRSVFPDAEIMPGEIGGQASAPDNSVDFPQLYQHFINGINYAGQPNPSPVSVLARSSHSFPFRNDLSPRERVNFSISSMEDVLRGKPPEFVKNLRLEYHQFGVLGTRFSETAYPVDARTASWQFQVLFRSKASGYMDKCWSWEKSERVEFSKNSDTHILNGLGWLYSVLDHLQGDHTWLLGVYQPRDVKRDITAAGFINSNRVTVILSSWSYDPDETAGAPVRISIPHSILPFDLKNASVRSLSFTDAENVYSEIRRDLAAAGNLQDVFKENPAALGTIKNMAADYPAARQMIHKNMKKYEPIQQRSLTLQPVRSGKMAFNEPPRSSQLELITELLPNEVTVLVFTAGEK